MTKFLRVESATTGVSAHATATGILSDCSAANFRFRTRKRRSCRNPPRLGQRHLAPELLQMRGHNRPSQGLRPLWRFEPDLERDGDSCQHATQDNNLEHGRWPFGADEGGLATEYRVNRWVQ